MADAPAAAVRKPCCVCDAPGGKHCTKCKSRHYCGKKCQLVDWNEGGHKAQCRQLATEFSDRLLDELMPAKKPKEAPAVVEDVAPAAGSVALKRLSAVRATLVKGSVPSDDMLDWRGICAICFDLLPVEPERQLFYLCCCNKFCLECAYKCDEYDEYDERCPLCRAPFDDSDAEALRLLQKHADKGNADAQVMLGNKYRDGEGLKKSVKRAAQLYELAAAQGNVYGQIHLGISYHRGDGVKINFKTAAQWYRRAAEQGYPDAQCNLAAMFNEGKGVAQSYEQAVKWYRLAAAQGNTDALFDLGVCHANGDGVPQDDHEALRLYKRAAAKGHAGAAAAAKELAVYLAAARSGPPA